MVHRINQRSLAASLCSCNSTTITSTSRYDSQHIYMYCEHNHTYMYVNLVCMTCTTYLNVLKDILAAWLLLKTYSLLAQNWVRFNNSINL